MLGIISVVLLLWGISAVVRKAESKKSKSRIEKLEEESKNRHIESLEIRKELQHQKREAEEEIKRVASLENARVEQEEWNAKQEAFNAEQEKHNHKVDEKLRKQEFIMQQAMEDIENLKWKIKEEQEYNKFLEAQRDKCAVGDKEYFKWQNKLSTSNDKIYRLMTRMNKASFMANEAQYKLREN